MAKARRRQKRRAKTVNGGVPVNAPGAPEEGSEAGDAGDVGHKLMVKNVRRYRAEANRHFKAARRLAGQAPAAAEQRARQAIASAVRAFWWAEDSELEEAQHILMHEIGRWTRRRFGCSIHFDGERYSQRCPLDIAHKRMGFSVGYTATLICSICGEDVSECSHLPDKVYWARGGPGPSGYCPVCGKEEGCRHRHDHLYRVTITRIVTEMQLREISLVPRPAGVTTRLTELPISTKNLEEAFGPDFKPGMPVSCDKCHGDCWGFDEFPYDAAAKSKAMLDEQLAEEHDEPANKAAA